MVKPVVESQGKSGKILRVNAPFDEALPALKQSGCKYPISARDLAYARMEKGKEHSLNTNGSYTKHGFLYLKGENPLVALNSPLLESSLAIHATQANRDGRYFSTPNEQMYEKFAKIAEQDKSKEPEKRRVLVLPSSQNFTISQSQNFDVLRGVLKDVAKQYLEFNGQDIPVYLVGDDVVGKQKGTLLTQMWFRWLDSDNRSALDGNYWDLNYIDRVRGVSSAGEATQKVLPYTSKDIKRNLQIAEGVREGKIPASKLEKVINFLQGLQ